MTDFNESRQSSGTFRIIRLTCLLSGFLLTLAGIFADHVGLSAGAGAGRGQIILASLGALLMLVGILGRRFVAVYKLFARIVLTVILSLCVLELASTAFIMIGEAREKQIEGDFVLRLAPELDSSYYPFTGWRCYPPDSLPDPDVLLLGGSAVALPRSDSIDLAVGVLLDSIASCSGHTISDYSQPFYNSTQSLIQLTLLLRDGLRPSKVLLVSGPGDVLAAIESGNPLVPLGTDLFRTMTWPGSEGAIALTELCRRTIKRETGAPAILTLIRNLGGNENIHYTPFSGIPDLSDEKLDSLSVAIKEMILVYSETMDVLAGSFSFDGHIIWLEVCPEDTLMRNPYYDLHRRTDLLITELAESSKCLATFKYETNVLPERVGSGYHGLDRSQSAELADSLMAKILRY